ncbi:hypothetical protein ACFV0T_34850 [Streptomyces sp. NPDC059582]|uniref:hypothetical protein n=1 Tax=Streptomyces sp. NPDC059582 TaxID=3346875 RepID=UPI003699A0F3
MTEQQQVAEPTSTEEPQVNAPAAAEADAQAAGRAETVTVSDGAVVAEAPVAEPVVPEPVVPRPPKDRRALRAVLRWTAAVGVFAAVATATTYGIAGMERTDVPGLATESDGRWEFPAFVRPPLPSGSPAPFAESNTANAHYADLRALLVPVPKGATQDKALRGSDGWLATKDYLAEYTVDDERQELGQRLVDDGLRHIAARGWTTPDGTRTRIYLLQFGTAAVADKEYATAAVPFGTPAYQVRGADGSTYDEDFSTRSAVSGLNRATYVEAKPYGPEQVRQGYVSAGDVVAVILQTRKGTAAAIPFQQTVTLQSQLLG